MAATWGTVKFIKQQDAWAVKGRWDGKRIFFSRYMTDIGSRICRTEDEARMLQMIISAEMERGNFNAARYQRGKKLYFRKYATGWLKDHRPNISYVTWRGYRGYLNNWLIPLLGDEFIADLNHKKIKRAFNYMVVDPETNKPVLNPQTEKPYSVDYRRNIYRLLMEILGDADKTGDIPRMPIGLSWSSEFKEKEWIDGDTQTRILRTIRLEDQYIFKFMFATGVRPSEARAIRKCDIASDHIKIRNTFAPVKGSEQLKEVKQKRERTIPIYASVRLLLDEMPKNLTEFIFLNPRTGKHYSDNINRDIWNPACIKALGYKIRLYDATRRSFINQLLESGVSMDIVSEAVGHSSVRTTRDFYAASHLNILKQAVDNVMKLK